MKEGNTFNFSGNNNNSGQGNINQGDVTVNQTFGGQSAGDLAALFEALIAEAKAKCPDVAPALEEAKAEAVKLSESKEPPAPEVAKTWRDKLAAITPKLAAAGVEVGKSLLRRFAEQNVVVGALYDGIKTL